MAIRPWKKSKIPDFFNCYTYSVNSVIVDSVTYIFLMSKKKDNELQDTCFWEIITKGLWNRKWSENPDQHFLNTWGVKVSLDWCFSFWNDPIQSMFKCVETFSTPKFPRMWKSCSNVMTYSSVLKCSNLLTLFGLLDCIRVIIAIFSEGGLYKVSWLILKNKVPWSKVHVPCNRPLIIK